MTAQRATLPDARAPWGEVVPTRAPLSVDDLHALPDDEWTYELLNGVLVRMPMSGLRATTIGSRLLARLQIYVEDNSLGVVTGEQGGYRLDPDHPHDTEVAPDVGFIRVDRLPQRDSPEYDKVPILAPDLAVEVASENQFAPGMEAKARLYLRFGTRLVWVIWPRYQRVDLWHPNDMTPTPLDSDATLDGEDVVPGFTYPVARLFL